MKYFKHFLFMVVLLYSFQLNSQYYDQQSIAYPPPFLFVSPNGSQNSVVTTNGFDNFFLGVDFGEPYIATNPRDIYNSVCAFNINNFYYTLDGNNWVKNSPVFTGYTILGDPVVTFDSLGNIYYSQLYSNAGTYGIALIKSTNKGISWVGPYSVYSTTAGLSDKEWIEADQTGGPYSNYIYVCWRQYGSNGMRFSRSTNGGVNWSTPLILSGDQGAYVSVGPNGNIQGGNVYFTATSGNSIIVYRSSNGGANFSSQVTAAVYSPPGRPCSGRQTVKNCIRINAFPRMAADNSYSSTRGNLYITYCARPGGADSCDIFLVRSTDYGITWSSPFRVNDDNTTNDQYMPAISVDPQTGKILVTWYDSRVDTAGNLLTRLFGTVSTNGGISFYANSNISDVSHNPNNMAIGQPGGHFYIGDYIGISPIRNTGYAVWMDGRNNNLGSYVSFFPDFALTVTPSDTEMVNIDSSFVTIKVPAFKGILGEAIAFSAVLDSLPLPGSIQLSFVNGRDSITNAPDSVLLKIKVAEHVIPRIYTLKITGRGKETGLPIHIRSFGFSVTVIGIKKISEVIPGEYSLYQNYPNPFNPSTSIKFDIAKSSNVTLRIYDITGREIVVLINQHLETGSYKYEWNAPGNLSSGIYFYRLDAGDFYQVRKLILIK